MSILGRLTVLPSLPEPLKGLERLARNLAWTWDPDARVLFRELDRELWERVGHNPLALLRDISQERLVAKTNDAAFVAQLDMVMARFDAPVSEQSWYAQNMGGDDVYAYFCAEYGWHESTATYSGGLGILAGDHTKAASELGVPLVAVGLWYPEGYFHQRVAEDGRQEAVYYRSSPEEQPLERVTNGDGSPLTVGLRVFGREVMVGVWLARVGRVHVYLLDVDLPDNHPDDRALLARLYGGDQRTRIAQEMILGIGGVRVLRALGIKPSAWHMNEGHSAFMALERCRELVAAGMPFAQARELVASSTVFTVHTPVAAGNDAFPFDLVSQAFAGDWSELGLKQQEMLELGQADHGWGPVFSMPALAIRFTTGRNGVAALHGETTRRIWSDLWPGVPLQEVPFGHVTNGVHAATWVASEIRELVSGVLPGDWRNRLDDTNMWLAVERLDPQELWNARQQVKMTSVQFLRRRVARQLERQEASARVKADAAKLFDPRVLTIGFARRFATYKRANLILRDLDRLHHILANPSMPVQLLFAGKAHPADHAGQELVRQIHTLSKDPRFTGRVLFLEDYDMALGRALTRGVDVWLNNPRRPLEASGTSGQKAAMNGVLNLSVLDGWWPEGFDGMNGWAIGGGREHDDEARGDAADAEELYELLEREVVPLYYERDARDVPVAWMQRATRAIASVSPRFNAQRMVKDYVQQFYRPAAARAEKLGANQAAMAADLASWRQRVREHWHSVHFQGVPIRERVHRVGEALTFEATLYPGALEGEKIRVELVYSREEDALQFNLQVEPMQVVETLADGGVRYALSLRPSITGRLVYGVRALPVHDGLASPMDAGVIRWG